MKTVNETVSIIVPVYNAEKYIVETMEHVTAQTYRDWELLLVVDGCGDASAQVIREYQEARGDERLRLLVSQENIGAPGQEQGTGGSRRPLYRLPGCGRPVAAGKAGSAAGIYEGKTGSLCVHRLRVCGRAGGGYG